ncbi:hypothetical protein MJM95_32145, partial [Salmonella enterica subsp. enterica serovar Anatum]|nr:hypothetical protein [Salmonella enterica subsp. enterica serovar Anatum]
DVHLMVKPVDRIVPDFAAAGASIITFHPEASEHVDRTLQLIKGGTAGLFNYNLYASRSESSGSDSRNYAQANLEAGLNFAE